MNYRLIVGDVIEGLMSLDAGSARCCVTSPPYWGLRDYGVDGQLGLEATPEEFIENMVAVFAEVRRVLADDGTLWLNMGDSYAAQRSGTIMPAETLAGGVNGKGSDGGYEWRGRGREGKAYHRDAAAIGLKHKDLVGMPWRLALALQQPRYTGRIKDERDRIWLAAMLDAEGCLFIHRRKAGQHNGQGYYRKNDNYAPGVEICNTSEAVVERIMKLVGKGSISTSEAGKHNRKQTLYRWNLRTTESRDFVREVYPYLIAKRHQARLLCGCPSSGLDAERAHLGLIALHRGKPTDIDFKPPESLLVPGWYLRSDIIWAKSNPMPESVTDRPTKSHEYLFLLSKGQRYYYDAEAIAEGAHRERFGNWIAGKPCPDRHDNGRQDMTPVTSRNARTVWTIPTQPYPDAHFATFPEALPERCIKAGSSERGQCPDCGMPWVRVVERTPMVLDRSERTHPMGRTRTSGTMLEPPRSETAGWVASCDCGAAPVPDTILDPFAGSGTTLAVALKLGRNAVGCELNPEYARLAEKRIGMATRPLTFVDPHGPELGGLFADFSLSSSAPAAPSGAAGDLTNER